jgi:hypothetical protein
MLSESQSLGLRKADAVDAYRSFGAPEALRPVLFMLSESQSLGLRKADAVDAYRSFGAPEALRPVLCRAATPSPAPASAPLLPLRPFAPGSLPTFRL